MSLAYTLLDVFADTPFQGTQIPVVKVDTPLSEAKKIAVAGEFRQTETVFFDPCQPSSMFSVYNDKKRVVFGAHTALAASYMAQEFGVAKNHGQYAVITLKDEKNTLESFIDLNSEKIGKIQFKRTISASVDRYTPDASIIGSALNIEPKHITYSKYKPLVVSVDHSVLIVPLTKPEHVVEASLDSSKWGSLLSEIYASEILLFAPGSISGTSDFHGRLINLQVARGEFPPIGKVMPEFIAYLVEQDTITEGTHTFTVDRGSENTRISVLSAEFDKKTAKETRCRIGGNVIKMGEGTLFFS